MAYLKPTLAWVSVMILAGAAGVARADVAVAEGTVAESTVTVTAKVAPTACEGLSRREARQMAKEAQRNDAHHRAAECWRVAGDHARADRALIRVAADTNEAARTKAEATVETAKLQARRIREAFR
jgi:hypothetical protein